MHQYLVMLGRSLLIIQLVTKFRCQDLLRETVACSAIENQPCQLSTAPFNYLDQTLKQAWKTDKACHLLEYKHNVSMHSDVDYLRF